VRYQIENVAKNLNSALNQSQFELVQT